MFQKLTCTILFLSLCICSATSQETWTIEKCIQYAQQNSLRIKQGENTIQQNKLSVQESKNARYPDFNASVTGGLNFGRTIDPVSNEFVSQTIGFNSFSINAGVPIYNGDRINNSVKQSKINVQAAEANVEQIGTELALQVAQAYLQILLDEEALANAKKRIEQTQAQLSQTNKLIQAGTRPQSERLEIMAQVARDEQSIVDRQNAVEISYLNLKQLLVLNPNTELKIDRPTAIISNSANPEAFTLDQIFNKALNTQPVIRVDQLNIQSAELDIELAKALRLPSVRLFGDLSTSFSNLDPRKYFTQIDGNFGQGLGVNVSIPIYNQNRTKIAMERANLSVMSNRIISQQNKQQLKTDIQRAIANARANKKQFEAAEKTVTALADAYSNTEKRYNLGAVNTFEYTSAKNSLDQAEVDLIIAKYNYLYSLKVVDFYQGKKITLR